MVDRIDPPKDATAYRVREAEDATKEEEREKQEEGEQEKGSSFFSEKTDWRLLYGPSSHTLKTITVMMQDVHQFVFQALSLKNNPSILEVMITYKTNDKQGPVFISLPRDLALRFQHFKKGQAIGKDMLGPMHYLQVIIPEPIRHPPFRRVSAEAAEETIRKTWRRGAVFGQTMLDLFKQNWKANLHSHLSWEWVLLYTVVLLIVAFFIFIIRHL